MPAPLRSRPSSSAFVLLGGGVVLLGVLLLLAPLPSAGSSAAWRALRDALHVPFFALLLVLVHALLLQVKPGAAGWALWRAIVIAAVIAVASEWAQAFTSRTPSRRDLLYNMLGIAAGAALILGARLRGSRWLPAGLAGVAGLWLAALWVAGGPWLAAVAAERRQAAAWPLLGDFEEAWESVAWVPQGSGGEGPAAATFAPAHATRGRQALHFEARGAVWAGVRVLLAKPRPWPDSRALCLDVFNPGDAFDLGIRVDWSDGSRSSAQVRIAPGANRCRVTAADLAGPVPHHAAPAATTIVFHLGAAPSHRGFYLDHVRLE